MLAQRLANAMTGLGQFLAWVSLLSARSLCDVKAPKT
jgi:hypothetical protein